MAMRRLLLTLSLLTAAVYAADFERSDWRTQLYFQAEPAFLNFKGENEILDDKIDKDVFTVPLSLGALWSPLITPAWKADLPFTLWLGVEVNGFQFGTIEDKPKYTVADKDEGKISEDEELAFRAYAPSFLAGFSVNLVGDLDLRILGGFGFQFFTFEDIDGGYTQQNTEIVNTAFVSGALEYRITEAFQDVDFKIGINVRRDFLSFEKLNTQEDHGNKNVTKISPYTDLVMDKVEYKWPIRVGLELSFDFGRESRRDRKTRFKLRDRDAVLREHREGADSLSDWDCITIERDYRFYLKDDGTLPDMSEAYTRTQFTDVLENFLVFCHPADLATKEQLYAAMDSNKVGLVEYQVKQEDSRFDQVMASNDPEMLKMFLEYYPNSPRRAEVENKLKSFGEYDAFRIAKDQNTFKAYLSYLNENPNGVFRDEAEAGIFALVKSSGRLKDYDIYLKRFPNGKYVAEAKAALKRAKDEAAEAEAQARAYAEAAPVVEQPAEPAVEEPAEEVVEEEPAPAKTQKVKDKKKKDAKKKPAKKAKAAKPAKKGKKKK